MILNNPTKETTIPPKARAVGLWRNLARYIAGRVLMLGVGVITAVYLTIIIANFGGYVDEIIASDLEFAIGMAVSSENMPDLTADERETLYAQLLEQAKDARGLNDPLFIRSARWLGDGLRLDWGEVSGRAYQISSRRLSVSEVILSNISRTLLVFGVANMLLFVGAVFTALALNRRHGSKVDRIFVLLSPLSSAPAWVYGVLLSTFFLRVFGFSTGGTFDTWYEGELRLSHITVILRHLILPFCALFLAGMFQTVVVWRSFFQVYSNEDYVDLAYAKGLSNGRIDRRYIMRPAMPALLTSFALLLAALWQEVIALEFFFNVQGIGRLFALALAAYDTPMIVAVVTVFAYLIALTVLVLDVCYAFLDPRIRVGNQKRQGTIEQKAKPKNGRRFSLKPPTLPRPTFDGITAVFKATGQRAWNTGVEFRRYPTAIVGLVIILFLFALSIYAVVAIPYAEAIAAWEGDDIETYRTPREALPAWVNRLRRQPLPPTIAMQSNALQNEITVSDLGDGITDLSIPFTFEYDYGDFPQDIVLDITSSYEERGPHVAVTWVWPNGTERELTSFQPNFSDTYFISRDERLQRRLRTDFPQRQLFTAPEAEIGEPLEGTYTLRLDVLHFEPDSTLEADMTLLGQVYGVAGTDEKRRDLLIPLLWGTPIALAFGITAATITSVAGMLFAALAAWYGGTVDRIVQYLTEVNLILPFFPVSLMIFVLYSRSILTVLAVVVALSIFGSAVKTYRATFLQVRNAAYVEAARAYGATDWRIVVRYMIPTIMTVLLPRLIILVPSYVFLEATLAFLGVSDPVLPTWGKLIVSALSVGVHRNTVHLVAAPFLMLFLTGFGFAMVGLALERIFEPRLQEQ